MDPQIDDQIHLTVDDVIDHQLYGGQPFATVVVMPQDEEVFANPYVRAFLPLEVPVCLN